MAFNNKKKYGIAAAAMSAIIAFTSCAQAGKKTEPSTIETPTYTIESTDESATSETVESIEETVGFSVETEPHTNPFGDFIFDETYNAVTADILNGQGLPEVMYGFDNPYSINQLQLEVYNRTGVMDTNLTLSDVNYFQYNPIMAEYLDGGKVSFSEHASSAKSYQIEAIRAVLSSQGLRFGIDEIPASYLMERFPRFYYDVIQFAVDDRALNSGEITLQDPSSINSLSDITDPNFKDFILFYACVSYNTWRLDCVYASPYGNGCIVQVRDASTGKNVLVPTDAEAQAMQEDINTIAGFETISIYTAETPEEFYNYYGYYPDDMLQNVGSLDTQEGFEAYINSLSSSEKSDLYINAIEDRLSNPEKGKGKSR